MSKVLIAEDDFIIGDLLEDYLNSEGYDVCGLANTVAEAVRLADLHTPDLAVFDFRLAHGDYGSQIRPLLKEKNNIGILFVSGDSLENKITKEDADGYIQKPYGLKDLADSLRIIEAMKSGNELLVPLYPKGLHLFKDNNQAAI